MRRVSQLPVTKVTSRPLQSRRRRLARLGSIELREALLGGCRAVVLTAGLMMVIRPLCAQTRDSAGIHIVENARPTWTAAQALHLAPAPSLVIGDRAGDPYLLSKVAGAVRLANGQIVVGDGASLQLRFFDSTGTFVKTVGRSGDGPGEFREMAYFRRLSGDTMVAVSAARATTSAFSGAGTFLWQTNANSPPVQLPPGIKIALATLRGGMTVITSARTPAPRGRGDRWVDSMPLVLVDRNNKTVRDLGVFPKMVVETSDGAATSVTFGGISSWASSPAGFFIGFSSEYSIREYDAAGKLVRIIRRQWTPVAVTRSDIDAYVTAWMKRWSKSTGAEAEKERAGMLADSYAKTFPAYRQFIADRTGRLWVQELAPADLVTGVPVAPSKWSVFDPRGTWLGDVAMPARFLPKEIGADYILGVARDADGVETVAMYRMRSGN